MNHRRIETNSLLKSARLGALAMAIASTIAVAAEPAADHGGHAVSAPPAAAASMPAGQQMPAMDHGDMQGQGGAAPPDARDPHANSGGYTLEAGPYALGGPRQLRFSDEHAFASVRVERFEAFSTTGGRGTGAYDLTAWFGRDYDRLVVKSDGKITGGKLQEANTELLWGHAVAPYWDTQLGLRHDGGLGPDRNWLVLGVQGLAPYWFDLRAAAYVGDRGRTALKLAADYELLVTQRLVLQPRVEANLYGKSDPERELGRGLADLTTGVRLRYEFRRQFAPYVGVEWSGKFGQTADFARRAGESTRDTRWVAGLRLWY